MSATGLQAEGSAVTSSFKHYPKINLVGVLVVGAAAVVVASFTRT